MIQVAATPESLAAFLRRLVPVAVAIVVLAGTRVDAGIAGSKHDLSTTGVDPYSNQVCAFCHTPHGANTGVAGPLWNRFVDQSQAYVVYDSDTLDTTPSQPSFSVSELCLGCHDGTSGTAVVNGISGNTKHDLVNAPGPGGSPDTTSYPSCRGCHPTIYGDPANLWPGIDLSNDHPISMTYPTTAEDPAFTTPPDLATGWSDVHLFAGRVECPSCHNPHDPSHTPFLAKPNAASGLCLTCHVK